VGRRSSRKINIDAKKNRVSGDTSIDLSGGKTTIEALSNSHTRSSVPKKKKERHS
jgi:hypothetical protein